MTNRFFDLMQPTIVKTSNHPGLAPHMRNRYLINYNVLGIKYFEQYYLLKESSNGIPYLIMKEDNWGIELEESKDEFDKILDIPRLYIDITEKFINGSDMFRSFIFQAIMENSIYAGGTEEFVPGKDYWLNSTLYNYLANTNQIGIPNFESRLPNYLTEIVTISEYFEDISDSPYKDYTNLDYYDKKNQLLDNKYTEDELKDFYRNFAGIILKDTLITDERRASGNNAIYDIVLNYYANYQSDTTSNTLGLILNSIYGNSSTSSGTSCSCNSTFNNYFSNSGSSVADTTTKSCSQIYEEAMALYLKQMLGDRQFYSDWFMIELSEWNFELNDVMVENLQQFINEFLELEFALDFGSLTVKAHNSMVCTHNVATTTGTSSSAAGEKNKSVINNYLKVLEFVRNKTLTENTNKIKIWGEKFAELLPSLQF